MFTIASAHWQARQPYLLGARKKSFTIFILKWVAKARAIMDVKISKMNFLYNSFRERTFDVCPKDYPTDTVRPCGSAYDWQTLSIIIFAYMQNKNMPAQSGFAQILFALHERPHILTWV